MAKSERRIKQREIVYKKFGGKCAYCGTDLNKYDFDIDHIIPRKMFNNWFERDNISNLNPSCHKCNLLKSNHSIDKFRELFGKALYCEVING